MLVVRPGSVGIVLLAVLGILASPAPSRAETGIGSLGCYAYSDNLPPLAPNAPVFSFVDISQTEVPISSLFGGLVAVPIGFPFDYYGSVYHTVRISGQGFLTFDAAILPGVSQPIPSRAAPDAIVAGFRNDLNAYQGPLYIDTIGNAPHRRFVIQFDEGSLAGIPPRRWQLILEEETGAILANYQTAGIVGLQTVAGIESPDGGHGISWRSSSQLQLEKVSVRYSFALHARRRRARA